MNKTKMIGNKIQVINKLLEYNKRSFILILFEKDGKYFVKQKRGDLYSTMIESYNMKEIEIYLKGFCDGL